MSGRVGGTLRARLAQEAARLMYEEEVKQYFTAKRMAAKRILGKRHGRKLRYRPQDLPSNGEIQAALLHLAELAEGPARTERLAAMRIVALESMRALEPFSPRLIGSVSTGHIRRGSDIDIQVFTDDVDGLERHLQVLGWVYDKQPVTIRVGGQVRDYLHFHIADIFAIELTIYSRRELRKRPRSSTDGKPINRLRAHQVEMLIRTEHPHDWHHYHETGTVAGLAALSNMDDSRPGPFDGLLSGERT